MARKKCEVLRLSNFADICLFQRVADQIVTFSAYCYRWSMRRSVWPVCFGAPPHVTMLKLQKLEQIEKSERTHVSRAPARRNCLAHPPHAVEADVVWQAPMRNRRRPRWREQFVRGRAPSEILPLE